MNIEEIKQDLGNRYYGCKLKLGEFLELQSQGFEFQPIFIYHKDVPGLVFMYESQGQGMFKAPIEPTMDDQIEFRKTECVGVDDDSFLKVLKIMDRATIKSRIDRDDYRIASSLDFFTLEEINSLLKYSIKNGKKNCTAVLLNYKNENYKDAWKNKEGR